MNINVNKETLVVAGKIGWRIGKAVVREGVQAIVINTVTGAIKGKFAGEIKPIKSYTLDDIIGEEKPKLPRKKWFAKKQKSETEELIEELKESPVDWENYESDKPKTEKTK